MQTNQQTILQKIVQDKAIWVENKQKELPLEQILPHIKPSDRNFYGELAKGSHNQPAYILECKKASPSKGLIRAEFDLDAIANVYKHYASAIQCSLMSNISKVISATSTKSNSKLRSRFYVKIL